MVVALAKVLNFWCNRSKIHTAQPTRQGGNCLLFRQKKITLYATLKLNFLHVVSGGAFVAQPGATVVKF